MSSDTYFRPEGVPYAFISIVCIKDIKIPFYEMLEHLACASGGLYTLTCYSYAEVAYYVEAINALPESLKVVSVDFADKEASNDAINNRFFGLDSEIKPIEGRESNEND